jgi:ubiquitin C-terminal hydrolase
VRKEPFTNISLDVFGNEEISLDECLVRYTHVEQLDQSCSFQCDSCGQKCATSKQLTFDNVPAILCMHFKRFQDVNAEKWEHKVKFPATIDLKKFMSPDVIVEDAEAFQFQTSSSGCTKDQIDDETRKKHYQ